MTYEASNTLQYKLFTNTKTPQEGLGQICVFFAFATTYSKVDIPTVNPHFDIPTVGISFCTQKIN